MIKKNSVYAKSSLLFSAYFVTDFFSVNSVVPIAYFLSPKALLTLSFDGMFDYTLTFLSNLFESRHRLITLIVLLKSRALLASDVVNFIPNTTRSGLGQSLTMIGYSSEFPDIAESSRIKKE